MNDQVNQRNKALPTSIEKPVNRIAFSIQDETNIIFHYVLIDASPKMRCEIVEQLEEIKYLLIHKKTGLAVNVIEWQERLIRIEYHYSNALVGADKIDWQELTDWLMTQALQRFSHE